MAVTSTTWPQGIDRARALFPGLIASATVAAAATFLSQHYGAPVMLFALLLGMAMNFLSGEGACKPGIEFTARQVLRVGGAAAVAAEQQLAALPQRRRDEVGRARGGAVQQVTVEGGRATGVRLPL